MDGGVPAGPAPLPGPGEGTGTLGDTGDLSAGHGTVRCRVCGRPLRGRQARRLGVGEDCRAKLGERTAPRPPARPVDQDTLPGL